MGCLKHKYTQTLLRFTFSQGGLCILVTLYGILGALMFRAIELSEDDLLTDRIKLVRKLERQKSETINDLKRLETFWAGSHPNDTEGKILDILKFHYEELLRTIELPGGEDGFYFEDDVGVFLVPTLQQLKDERANHWSIPSAILFTATILTTIGYGHVYPKSAGGMIAVICYAIFAIPIMSMWLMQIGALLANLVRWVMDKVLSRRKIRSTVDRPGSAWSADSVGTEEETSELANAAFPAIISAVLFIVFVVLGMGIYFAWEGWSLVESFYFVIISITSIGFGDYVPGVRENDLNAQLELVVSALYLLIGIALLAMVIDLMTDVVGKSGQSIKRKLDESFISIGLCYRDFIPSYGNLYVLYITIETKSKRQRLTRYGVNGFD